MNHVKYLQQLENKQTGSRTDKIYQILSERSGRSVPEHQAEENSKIVVSWRSRECQHGWMTEGSEQVIGEFSRTRGRPGVRAFTHSLSDTVCPGCASHGLKHIGN